MANEIPQQTKALIRALLMAFILDSGRFQFS